MTTNRTQITVTIPTYSREQVLIDTLQYLLVLQHLPAEILVLDQTEVHKPLTEQQLAASHGMGVIRWVRLAEPSIPKAMNQGLLLASQNIVLFLDDDIRPEPELLTEHLAAHTEQSDVLAAGRVIQPWQEGADFSADSAFHFTCLKGASINEFMGGNFSLQRDAALMSGSFDEKFVRVAYRFMSEFFHRSCASGLQIWFEQHCSPNCMAWHRLGICTESAHAM